MSPCEYPIGDEILYKRERRISNQRMICPNCGEQDNFDMKEIQKGKPWRVTCATCGFNGSEKEFE